MTSSEPKYFLKVQPTDTITQRVRVSVDECEEKYGCESWTIKKAECQRIDAF